MLRNLHLRKDALMHLGGVPLAAAAGEGFGVDDDHDDDDDDSDDDSDEEYSNDGDNHGDNENNTESSFAQVVDNNFINEKNAINDNSQEQDNGDDDEDSFQSCASHLDTDSEASDSNYLHPGINATHGAAHATNNNQSDNTIPVQQQQNQQQQQQQQHTVNNKHERNPSHDVPSIEIVHGSIGSLELHIPWRLLRSTSKIAAAASSGSGATSTSSSSLNLGTNEKDVNNAGNHDNSNDDGLKCSVVLSDVRILLAPNNHTRGSSGDCGSVGRRSSSCKRGGTKREDNSATKNNDNRRNNSSIRTRKREGKQHKLEKIRQERELAVQSFLEGELFRRARSGTSNNNKENSNNSNNDDGGATNTANTNDAVEDSRDGWLARWAKGLVARILSSLRVTIRNIHIRYEDKGCGWFEDASASSITSMNNDNVSSVSGLMSELLLSNQQQNHQRRRQYRPAFAIGMRLENFSIRNAIAGKEKEGCNKGESMATNDAPAAASATLLQLHNKVANVENLSVYWDSAQSDLFVGSSAVQFETEDDRMYYERRFEELDCTSCTGDTDLESSKHQYIIEPISPSLHLTMADPNAKDAIASGPVKKLGKGNDECSDLSNNETQNPMSSKNPTASPSIHAALHLPSCHVGFDRNTLEDIAYLRKCYASSIEIINCFKDRTAEQRIAGRLSLLRPPSGCGPKDNPRLWWKYAIGAVKILQENIVISEVGMEVKKRKWRRKGWPGVAHLLRLRNEYTELYLSLWSSLPNNDVEGKNEVHANLMALEELLNIEEIVAFRISVYSRISNNNGDDREIEKLRASESSEFDELALGRLSVLSLEYRETKLKQIVRAFDSDIESSQHTGDHINGVHTNEFLVTDEIDAESLDKDSSPVWTISISSENFTIQANDALNTSNFQVISAPPKLKQRPIVRLDCSFSLRFDVFSNGSWGMSCMLRSLTISDLISPLIDKSSKRRTLVARKQPKTFDSDNKNQMSQRNEHNASILIRNVVAGHDDRQLQSNETQATTFLEVSVSPLEIIYSTNAFEALSRLFAAVKTTEFSRDYERLSQALSRWRSEQRKRLMSVLAQQKKFVVSVAISAPVLVVPDDHQHLDSPTLTIDFGRFTFQSETSTLVPSKFDDKWQLQIANVRAFCTQTDKSKTDTNAICEHAIIEPFSLNFSILTHFAADDSNGDMTKISIEAMLPRLSFNLTTSAVQLVSRLQVRWSNAKLRNTQRDLQSTHDNMSVFTNEISSWRQRHPELFSALRNRGSLPDEAAPEKMLLKKQEVTFSFSAPTIALQISNDVGFQQPIQSTKHMAPLMNLSIRGIRGHFVSNVTEEGSASHFSARLRSIYVQDIEKHQSHFRHFLSSVEPDILQESDLSSDCLSTDNTIMNDFNDEDEDLVVVEFAKKSNGDKDLSIQFNELYIEWNPEFLARVQKSLRLPSSESSTYNTPTDLPILTHYSDVDVAQHNSHEYEFFDALDETDTWNSSETIGGAFSSTSINNENGGVGVPTAGPDEHPAPPFNISFSLSKLRVNFNKDSQMRCLFIVEMNRTKTSCFLKPLGGSKITATVADMRFIDPEGVTGGTLYSQIIGVQPEALGPATSIVQMEFETFPPLLSNKNSKINSNGSREYDNLMKLDFSAMRFVFISQLWLEMLDYYVSFFRVR